MTKSMLSFARYIGIDYSGDQTPSASLSSFARGFLNYVEKIAPNENDRVFLHEIWSDRLNDLSHDPRNGNIRKANG